ncbi:hypothetical protein F3Y22_tig00117048pilonHSYRG00681 [Hibiscus syriacus]|uniref:Uncharacterized protein n=1 Tax=Hibiscus syriacus TaxID=106335 RepID=A0A6A2WXV9_HIBSY|nr:hypothetical protein F3Y22_tig00117048pilonHSYRG00681 [Hibiscus syriacus]
MTLKSVIVATAHYCFVSSEGLLDFNMRLMKQRKSQVYSTSQVGKFISKLVSLTGSVADADTLLPVKKCSYSFGDSSLMSLRGHIKHANNFLFIKLNHQISRAAVPSYLEAVKHCPELGLKDMAAANVAFVTNCSIVEAISKDMADRLLSRPTGWTIGIIGYAMTSALSIGHESSSDDEPKKLSHFLGGFPAPDRSIFAHLVTRDWRAYDPMDPFLVKNLANLINFPIIIRRHKVLDNHMRLRTTARIHIGGKGKEKHGSSKGNTTDQRKFSGHPTIQLLSNYVKNKLESSISNSRVKQRNLKALNISLDKFRKYASNWKTRYTIDILAIKVEEELQRLSPYDIIIKGAILLVEFESLNTISFLADHSTTMICESIEVVHHYVVTTAHINVPKDLSRGHTDPGNYPEVIKILGNCPEVIKILGNCPEVIKILGNCPEVIKILDNCPEVIKILGNCPEVIKILGNCPYVP